MARSVFQYEQPRCPDNWNEAERRFYNRLIETLDDIYSKYGRLDEKMLSKGVLNRIDNSTATSLEKMTADILSSGKIAADSIEATFAYLVSLSAKYGSFDFETVKNLVADAMVLEKGQADYVHIMNLAATYAQAVNATIGNLVIQSSDGKYYQLDVSADGKVSASEVKPSDKEISAGETSEGKVIVGTHITAETLGTATLAATQALINMIDASRINVGTLVAREEFVQTLTANEAFVDSLVANTAFIKQLGTTTIVGDKSITMLAGEVDNLDRLSSIEVIEGTFAQADRREGEGIRVYSEIKLKQDLKYGNPYPGGGGKNLLKNTATSGTKSGITFTVNDDGSIIANGTATGDVHFPIGKPDLQPNTQYILTGAISETSRLYYDTGNGYAWDFNSGAKFTTGNSISEINAVNTLIRSGAVLNNEVFYPMIRLASDPDASYAPYANICPIEGRTKLTAAQRGKNLIPSMNVESYEYKGIKFVRNADGTITVNGTATGYVSANSDFVDAVPLRGKTLTIKGGGASKPVITQVFIRCTSGNVYKSCTGSNMGALTFVMPDDANTVRFEVYVSNGQAPSNLVVYPQLEYGEVSTEYEPYRGADYTISFGDDVDVEGGVVYGGTVDWHAGEVTVDYGFYNLDGAVKPYEATVIGEFTRAGFNVLQFVAMDYVDGNTDGAFSHGQYLMNWGSESTHAYANDFTIIVTMPTALVGSTVDSFAEYLAAQNAVGTPVQISYKLAEPITIQLTPTQITSLSGTNIIYTDADGGRVEFGHSLTEDMQNAIDALEEAQRESALYLKLDDENKVVRIGQTEVTSEFDIDAYGASVVVGGETFSRFEGSRVVIGGMEMRKPANIGGLAFDSIMT